jgi:hypothetical protein
MRKNWAQWFLRRNRELRVRKPNLLPLLEFMTFKKYRSFGFTTTRWLVFMCWLSCVFGVDESVLSRVKENLLQSLFSKTGWDYQKFWEKMRHSVVDILLEVPLCAQKQGGWRKICSVMWLNTFFSGVQCSSQNPTFLIMDNHVVKWKINK